MKTLSGKISFVALAIVAIVAVLSLRAFAMASRHAVRSGYRFYLEIGEPGKYVPLTTTQDKFDRALCHLEKHGQPPGKHDIEFLSTASAKPIHPYVPCRVSIKTDKVTKSEVADRTVGDASAANDPNVVNHLHSNDAADIKAVLDCFQ